MNRNNIKNLIEYFSLILVISFFLIHNIYLVFTGMVLSIGIINRKMIDSLIIYIKNIKKSKEKKLKNKHDKLNKLITIEENSNCKLVYKIEELGFIPSMNNNDESNIT